MSMSPQVPLGTCPFLVRPVSQPWVGRRVWCNPRVTFDGKVRNLGPRTFCLRPKIRFPPTVEYPEGGYTSVGSFLFLKEQIKDIIIMRTTESTPFRQTTVSDTTENLTEAPPRSPAPVSTGGRSGVGKSSDGHNDHSRIVLPPETGSSPHSRQA